MMTIDRLSLTALILGVGGVACAGLDNPTALADLELDVDFDIEAVRVETFEEVEIHVVVREGGAHLQMLESRMEIEHHRLRSQGICSWRTGGGTVPRNSLTRIAYHLLPSTLLPNSILDRAPRFREKVSMEELLIGLP